MGYFRPATLSFTAPRDFFDNTGKNAPLTKITIEMPREFKDYATATGDAPYDKMPIDPQVLDEIQAAVMREYGGVARQFLGAFRQGAGLSGLAITGRTAALGEGVGMQYSQQFGREIVGIHVSAEAVRKLVGQASDRCMLILYGGNKIAAVKMSDITKSSWTTTYKKTSAHNWTPSFSATSFRFGPLVGTQLRFGPKAHIAAMNIKINSDGTIADMSADPKIYYYNTEYSLLDCVTRVADEIDYSNQTYFNGDATQFFQGEGHRFTIAASGKITYSSRTYPIANFGTPVIKSDGGYYGGMDIDNGNGIIGFGGGGLTTAQKDAIDAIVTVSPPLDRLAYSSSGGPGANSSHATVVSVNPSTPNRTWSGGGSESTGVMVYSNNGKVDKISCAIINGSYSISGYVNDDTGSIYGEQNDSSSHTAMGLSGTVTAYRPSGPKFYGPGDPAPAPTVVRTYSGLQGMYPGGIFHFTTNFDDMWLNIGYWNSDGSSYLNKHSPYGFNLSSASEWIFAANGKHQFSTIRVAPGEVWEYRHFLDRVEVSSKVDAIVGGEVIDMVLLDVKLADIKKLK